MTTDLLCPQYKALYKDTFKDALDATGNELLAESVAMERVLAAALLTVGEARREIAVIDGIRAVFVQPTQGLH